jgi:hypothetical protein
MPRNFECRDILREGKLITYNNVNFLDCFVPYNDGYVPARRWSPCRLGGDLRAGSEVIYVPARRWSTCRLGGDLHAGSEAIYMPARRWSTCRLGGDLRAGSEVIYVPARRWSWSLANYTVSCRKLWYVIFHASVHSRFFAASCEKKSDHSRFFAASCEKESDHSRFFAASCEKKSDHSRLFLASCEKDLTIADYFSQIARRNIRIMLRRLRVV